jgi:hypothetical protein
MFSFILEVGGWPFFFLMLCHGSLDFWQLRNSGYNKAPNVFSNKAVAVYKTKT